MPFYQPEYSDEAWTLDYLNPGWYPYYEDKGPVQFVTREEAEAFEAQKRAETSDSRRCFRVREVETPEERAERAEREYRAEAEYAAQTPGKGKKVVVVTGRKVPVGTTGECFWYGEGKSFGYSRFVPMRVGFKDEAGETYWTDASNVEVVGWESYLPESLRAGVAA